MRIIIFFLMLCTSASCFANDIYLTIKGGVSALNSLKVNQKETTEDLGQLNLSNVAKEKNGNFVEAGIGLYLTEKVRAEVSSAYYFNWQAVGYSSNKMKYNDASVLVNVKTSVNSDIKTSMAGVEIDIFDCKDVSFFSGASVGVSRIWQNLITNVKVGNEQTKASEVILVPKFSSKKTNNFSYGVSLGASTKLFSEQTFLVITYTYKDLGKVKTKTDRDIIKTHYKGHHLSLGFRINI